MTIPFNPLKNTCLKRCFVYPRRFACHIRGGVQRGRGSAGSHRVPSGAFFCILFWASKKGCPAEGGTELNTLKVFIVLSKLKILHCIQNDRSTFSEINSGAKGIVR